MTSTVADVETRPIPTHRRNPQRAGVNNAYRWLVVVVCAAAGILGIGYSYRLSAGGASPNAYYGMFWLAAVVMLAPAVGLVIAPRIGRVDRFTAIILVAALTAVPKFLRNPDGPLYHDEYSHWRQAVDTADYEKLLRPNWLIPIVQYFPGTAGLTSSTSAVTGASIWSSGQLLVATMHVLGICAVYVLVRQLLGSDRAGGIGAVIYALNPSSMHFDTQYAYESVGINIYLWVLAFGALAATTRTPRVRYGYLAAAACSAMACVVTHHLTTVFLIAVLVVITVVVLILRVLRARRGTSPLLGDIRSDALDVWAWLLLITAISTWVWFSTIAKPTITYLSPYFGGSVDQLTKMATEDRSQGRELLAASVQPLWERGITALAPLLVAASFVYVAWLVRRGALRGFRSGTGTPGMTPTIAGLVCFGVIYFLSVPFVLAPSGAEGARRSWGFTYVGVAVVIAIVAITVASRVSLRRWWSLMVVLLVVLLIGNVGAGLNDPYRFPGQFRWGSDTNSVTPEARTVGEVMFDDLGQVRVISEAYTSLQLIAYGRLVVGQPASGFTAWDLTQTPDDPSPELAGELATSHFEYLIFDSRIAAEKPFNGYNYGLGDPLLGKSTPQEYIDRLDRVPWAWRVLSTEHVRVYRLDMTQLGKPLVGGDS